MAEVLISGLTLALDRNRITFVKLLQRQACMSLPAAKESMERCVMGEAVVIAVQSLSAAEELAAEASRLGAIAEVRTVEQPT